MSNAYRSAYQHLVGTRLAELRYAREIAEPWLPSLLAMQRARVARTIAGAVGIVAVCAMVGFASFTGDSALPTYALLGGIAATVGTYGLVRLALRYLAKLRPARPVEPTLKGDLDSDLAAIDASDPIGGLRKSMQRFETWGMDLPLVAGALLVPLSLHALFVALFDSFDAKSFALWIRISLVVVGHAHIGLAIMAVRFARKLRRTVDEDLGAISLHREWGRALAVAVGVSALPGIVLFVVPPALSALTGICFIPLLFLGIGARYRRERHALAQATKDMRSPVRLDPEEPAAAAPISYASEPPPAAIQASA